MAREEAREDDPVQVEWLLAIEHPREVEWREGTELRPASKTRTYLREETIYGLRIQPLYGVLAPCHGFPQQEK